ncbi:hypothetical protein CDIK_0178 [Cucumispora dikerogammari]|nr:hypothetical protein CDIK_0178 [Cucumispora dikerogammari]
MLDINKEKVSGFLCSCDANQARTAKKEILTILNTLDLNKSRSETENLIQTSKGSTTNSCGGSNFVYEKLRSIKNMFIIFNHTKTPPSEILKELNEQKITLSYIKKTIPLDIIVTKDVEYHLKNYLINKEVYKSFKINFRKRCSDKDYKENIFQMILKRYEDVKIDLMNPTFTIFVEVVTKFVGLSVIRN